LPGNVVLPETDTKSGKFMPGRPFYGQRGDERRRLSLPRDVKFRETGKSRRNYEKG